MVSNAIGVLDENNSKGKEISEEKSKKSRKRRVVIDIVRGVDAATLRGQLNEVTSSLDELNGLLKKITRS